MGSRPSGPYRPTNGIGDMANAVEAAKKLTHDELRAIGRIAQNSALWPGLVAASARHELERR
jgi:hypothetical protein